MPADKAIKVLGEMAYLAILKEASQVEGRNVIEGVDRNKLDKDTRKGALNSLTFVTKKRNGKVKGRTCADVRKQRLYIYIYI